MGKKKADAEADDFNARPFTDLIPIEGSPVVFHGHLSRSKAMSSARAHYVLQAARAHAAVEAIDRGHARVRWRIGNNVVRSPSELLPLETEDAGKEGAEGSGADRVPASVPDRG